ncbi:MAG: cytochrome c [Deltaproteobacteria bacterium]|nr:cytochrome c [Deltaproteobacteria bacterium]
MNKILVSAAFALALSACSEQKPAEPAPPPPPPVKPVEAAAPVVDPAAAAAAAPAAAAPAAGDPKAEADQIFATRCTVCHGATGKGDGPGAAALNPKPRDYSDAAWQKSITDDVLAKVILEGGQAIGKSPLMAPSPDLKGKPEVVKALVAKVRSFNPTK